MCFVGDGVIAALGPRITTQNSPQPHEAAFESAEALDRFVGILGAGRIILTLGSGVRGDSSLIKSDEL